MKRHTAVNLFLENLLSNIKDTYEIKNLEEYSIWSDFKKNISPENPKRIIKITPKYFSYSALHMAPETFDYKRYIKKKIFLETEIENCNYIINLNKKNIIKLQSNTQKDIIIRPYEMTIEFSPDATLAKTIEEILTDSEKTTCDLVNYKKALEKELKRVKNHISWLEEDIESLEEIFKKPNKINKSQITRKIEDLKNS